MIPLVATLKNPTQPPGRGSLRIIGGGWRGRRVHFPDIPGLRPTPDRVRETLFNWLQQAVTDARCLDLFAGSGALGLEALSRGAREVVFVEHAAAAAATLQTALQTLGGAARARVIETDAARFLAGRDAELGAAFDIVFVDPPFGQGALLEFLPQLALRSWVRPGGLVYIECERRLGAPQLPAGWDLLRSKSAGEVGYHLARTLDVSR
jgi:16S rRNA (guanine966-N2)-methyltransferase